MQLGLDKIKEIIAEIGFTPQNGKSNIYSKAYSSHDEYMICVDFNAEKIEYYAQDTPKEVRIKLGDGATSNFARAENFVVLECVDRLLEKGYAPSSIELEKTYPSGRGHSGRLDILVNTPEGIPYLMVECKTWGTEYKKEKKKMLKDGGQLFAYYVNDRAAKYLCLYTSRLSKEIEYNNCIIEVNDSWRGLSGTKDIYTHWNKNFRDNGIFEMHAAPYDVKHKALTYGMLKNLKKEDSGKIYNQIMEILRHNAISDKPNAFNKLLNLFVCKIIDENKNDDEELQFQWLESDTDERLQMRLNDLYMEGMWRFLEIKVIDYKERDVSEKLENIDDDSIKKWVLQMYEDTRLKKSPNFAFVEVQDEKTFQHNAKVVREIVELLQGYRFRYEQKHEFLGNFFELLLNTSMKQEAGQFFTPTPITRFIISSIPLREVVQKRIDDRMEEPLPAVIDYACGSGHFLTEYMSQLQEIIDTKINTDKTSPTIRSQFQAWQGPTKFLWAKDYVYGIDFDNRLVKTTKVSAFFNGDGEATIVWANGLDSFSRSEEYRGKLKVVASSNNKDNGQFDILLSNPPYSVEAFKSTLQHGEESFELYQFLTDNSSEIECLFVERMKQLLRVGGCAGIILPSSLLSNSGIHSKAREVIFKYFKVKSIVELGSGTFMETGTNTIILFLERRNDNDHIAVARAIDTFFVNKKDVNVIGVENAFSTYVTNVYDDLSFEDYVSLIACSPNENVREHDLCKNYEKTFGSDFYAKMLEVEKEKMLYFMLTHEQEIVLVKTGEKREGKQFLGYEFSKRRGREGIRWLPGGTMLYAEGNSPLDYTKVNSYVYNAFLGKKISIDESLKNNVSYGKMSGYIDYTTSKFDKVVNLNKKTTFNTPFPLESLGELADVVKGVSYSKEDQVYYESENIILTADNVTIYGDLEVVKKIFLKQENKIEDLKKLKADDIFICFSSGSKNHVGKSAYIESDMMYYAGGFMGILRRKPKREDILMKYLWLVLSSTLFRDIISQGSAGANINNLSSSISSIKIPLPPRSIQQNIIDEIGKLGLTPMQSKNSIHGLRSQLEELKNSKDDVLYKHLSLSIT